MADVFRTRTANVFGKTEVKLVTDRPASKAAILAGLDWMKSVMPGRLVAIFDACHSGAAAESLQVGRTEGLVRDLLSDDCGVVVLCSSLGSEYSLEASVTKGGVFTFGLLEGLKGEADLNGDGFVFIDEVVLDAAVRVKQLTGGIQNPTLGRSPHVRPFPLARGK